MVEFFCRQERTFGLGNFINCTPVLKALSDYYGEPIPVLFESVGDAFNDAPFIKQIEKPQGRELFGSYDINSRIPDWQYLFEKVQNDLNIKLGEIPESYVDKVPISHSKDTFVILRGCFSNIPHKVAAKDPGDDIYIKIIRYLQSQSTLKPVFVGTRDDYIRNSFVHAIIGKGLQWKETSLREALGLVNGAKFVIGNDTGLMHASAALKKDAFCIWHKTNVIKNQARGKVTYSYNSHFERFRKWISGLI